MATTIYPVTGMTCEHCVRAVTSELGALAGVSEVGVELVPDGVSQATVTSAAPLPEPAVAEALDAPGGYGIRARYARPPPGPAAPTGLPRSARRTGPRSSAPAARSRR